MGGLTMFLHCDTPILGLQALYERIETHRLFRFRSIDGIDHRHEFFLQLQLIVVEEGACGLHKKGGSCFFLLLTTTHQC